MLRFRASLRGLGSRLRLSPLLFDEDPPPLPFRLNAMDSHVVRGVPLIARTRTGYPVSSDLVSAKVWLDTFSCPVRWQEDGLPSAWNYSSFGVFKRCVEKLDIRVFDYLFSGDCNSPLLAQLEHLFTVEHFCAWGPFAGLFRLSAGPRLLRYRLRAVHRWKRRLALQLDRSLDLCPSRR
ncbi:unnamed protein product [Polarella glacialis]|uniref:Uncharacterized protein n=1 Tax=Polarella glacialis TaxID=89957 RepID=A0A813JH80_POLGL|nr:unnamed protein product [Polarella glacialis]